MAGDFLLRPGLFPVQEGKIPFDRFPDGGAVRGLVYPEVLADLFAGQGQLHEAQQVHAAIAPGLGPGHFEGLLAIGRQLAVETLPGDFAEVVLGEIALAGVDGVSGDLEVIIGAVIVAPLGLFLSVRTVQDPVGEFFEPGLQAGFVRIAPGR